MLPLELDAIARDICHEAIALYGRTPEWGRPAQEAALALDDVQPVAELNICLIQLLGASCYLRDKALFRAAAHAITGLAAWLAKRFEPEPRHILSGLALSMIGNDLSIRRTLARAVLTTPFNVEVTDETGIQARILAATSDLDRRAASIELERLRNAIVERRYTRLRSRNLLGFSKGSRSILEGDISRFSGWLRHMDGAERAFVSRELSRARRNEATAIIAASFIDLPAAALASVTRSRLPRKDRDTFPQTLFSDALWMTEALWA